MIVFVIASAIRGGRLLGGTYESGIERRGTGVVVALNGIAGAGKVFGTTGGGGVERVGGFGAGLGNGGFGAGFAGRPFG